MYSFYTLKRLCEKSLNLKFIKSLQERNAQGSCGIMKYESEENLEEVPEEEVVDCRDMITFYKTNTVFYKFGNNGCNCTLARQEFIVSNQLLLNLPHFPNFLRPLVYTKNHLIHRNTKKNPFSLQKVNKSTVTCADIIIFEYLAKTSHFWDMMTKEGVSKTLINSTITQICLAILCAQKTIGFVHNDLHANNILMHKCPTKLKILYRLRVGSEERFFLVPTMGFIPIIIDFGYAYSSDCENYSLEIYDVDNYGLITYKSDEFSDFIRFFSILHQSGYDVNLRYKISNMFSGIPVSLKSSWENIVKKHSCYFYEELYRKINREYGFFNETTEKIVKNQIMKLFPRIITLPLAHHETHLNIKDLEEYLTKFLLEWNNICMFLKFDFEKIYIFRELVDLIRKYKTNYDFVATLLFESIFSVTGFEIPIKVNWKLLIDSALNCATIMKNTIYENTSRLENLRNLNIKKKLVSPDFMFLNIENFVYKKTQLDKDDFVLLIDDVNKQNCLIHLDYQVEENLSEEEYYNLLFKKKSESIKNNSYKE